ncbi:hypothetical protein [Faecalitalea cylindroides]
MKAFISDFDGTIFFPEREEKISRNDVYAIKELKKFIWYMYGKAACRS